MKEQAGPGLIEHFEHLSEAPGAMGEIRRLILDLAVRGKLVSQDAGDEPLKIGSASTTPAKIPFEIPKTWRWVCVSEVADSRLGKMLDQAKNKGHYRRYLRNVNVRWYDFDLSDILEMRFEDSELEEFRLRRGDILICEGGEPGRAAVWDEREADIYFQKAIHRVRFSKIVDSHFFVHVLRISATSDWLTGYFTGTGIKHLTGRGLAAFRFPLPPLAEQKRIVAKVDQLMALCDRLEAAQTVREYIRDRLAKASLQQLNTESETKNAPTFKDQARFFIQHLPRISTRPEHIGGLRQAILNLAVRGKLVSQDAGDEPAGVLLKRIDKERTRLLKQCYPNGAESNTQLRKQEAQVLPPSLDRLPRGWQWTTLMQCALLVIDCHNKTAPYSTSGIMLVRTTNVRNGSLNMNEMKFVDEETYVRWSARCPPEPGDILITREAPMGEVCIIPDGAKICLGQRMMLVRLVPNTIDSRFMLYSLRDPDLMSRVQDKPVGATVKHLRVGGVETLLIPLPPLAEQKRIVAKVDQLMALCDQLEQQITTSQTKHISLLKAILQHINTPKP